VELARNFGQALKTVNEIKSWSDSFVPLVNSELIEMMRVGLGRLSIWLARR
jgi:hypothetical protein